MKLITTVFLILIAALTTTARADFVNGNMLTEWCAPRNASGPTSASCLGYVAGVSDDLATNRYINNAQKCVPDSVSLAQLGDVVVRYLYQHPEQRHLIEAQLLSWR